MTSMVSSRTIVGLLMVMAIAIMSVFEHQVLTGGIGVNLVA
jgi:hypothetical protein